jgi:hypothetical protein
LNVADLARNLENDPARFREAVRYYEALVGVMNVTTGDDGTQDALCVYEAIALLLGQLTAGVEPDAARGVRTYVYERAQTLRDHFVESGNGAKHFIEDLN